MKKFFYIFSIAFVAASCSDKDFVTDDPENKVMGDEIKIGGIETSALDVSVSSGSTRADVIKKDAETIDWLVGPLESGLDIWYWKDGGPVKDDGTPVKDVAILRLEPSSVAGEQYATDPDTKWAIYSFKYKTTENGHQEDTPAVWYGNGAHHFEGMYVPDNIRYGSGVTGSGRTDLSSVNNTSAKDIITNQSAITTTTTGDVQNYTFLERYLAMPANTKISATVGRVKLPFYHRLARVLAYVLIDPEMGSDVTLKGFNLTGTGVDAKDDPTTTSIKFCDVDVLTGVHDTQNADGTHTLTPQWSGMNTSPRRKVTPHFWKMSGSMDKEAKSITGCEEHFIMYYDDNTAEYIFPTDDNWADYHKDYGTKTAEELKAAKITKTDYGLVPVYDLIVRPTYTSLNNVMYDEEGYSTEEGRKRLYENTNIIHFELTLKNDLIYNKEFKFDLDANYQTVVYLRISRESIDYNASGSELWTMASTDDDWYGLDNTLGHSLSMAGSSWQRAFTYGKAISGDVVTDGDFYNESTTPDDGVTGQYLSADTWIDKFVKAFEGGDNHGDYFILTKDITIDASMLPENFVFTGHLDARGHTITLTGERTALFTGLDGVYTNPQEGQANLHKEYKDILVPTAGWRAEVINVVLAGGKLFTDDASITGNVQNCSDVNGVVLDHKPALPIFD